MLLLQRNSKTQSFLNKKLRYSSETELINNFDKKSQFRFDCKNTTFCEHHKYKQSLGRIFSKMTHQTDHFPHQRFCRNPKFIEFCFQNIFQELFQTWNPFHNVMALWSHQSIIFPSTQQNENENCLWALSKRKLKQANLKFSNVQNH